MRQKNHEKKILVAGGDLRYGYTAASLADHLETYAVGFQSAVSDQVQLVESVADKIPLCDVLVLPMPVSDDGILVNAPFSQRNISISHLLTTLKPGALVLGGKFGKSQEIFEQSGFETMDYLVREEFSTRNAVPTAEGAIQIMLEEMPCTICGSQILILGFGKIGSRLAATLHAMGAEVTVVARNVVKRAEAEMLGCRSVAFSELEHAVKDADVICNTVPALVLTESILEQIRQDALILDLASKPGGVDWDAAQTLGKRVVWALSLPGKTAPVTAGRIIAKTILHILDERGILDV
ncbi:MAG: dipicolinate synthase subunit DpsA [Oscillospiraceae bacterium]|nr:dipicolinate synthase subunit DpsA [Oscillospiraceae bacterium]